MEFKSHQLSPANLVSIFNSAFIDAQLTDDDLFCLLKDKRDVFIWVEKERNLINYFCQLALPEDFKESDARLLVNSYNARLPLLKTYYQSNKNKSNINIIFRYEYALLEHDTVNPKTLVRLHRIFQEIIDNSGIVYRELFVKHDI